jgi:hypothetical protein
MLVQNKRLGGSSPQELLLTLLHFLQLPSQIFHLQAVLLV